MIGRNAEEDLFNWANTLLDGISANTLTTKHGTISRTVGKLGLASVLLNLVDGTQIDLSQEPITDSMPLIGADDVKESIGFDRIIVEGFINRPNSEGAYDAANEQRFPGSDQDIALVVPLLGAAKDFVQNNAA